MKMNRRAGWKMAALSFCICAAFGAECMAEEESGCQVRIVHTNDIHGYYTATDNGNTGFAYLKALTEEVDADLLLDVGDTFHGQAFATVEDGESIAELMKAVGYDAMTPGNHDWSYGADQLKELGELSGTPILAANVVTDDGEAFFDASYVLKDVTADDGTELLVGVVGAIDDDFYHSTYSGNVTGLTFEEETAAVTKAAKELKERENCDIVLAITHQKDCEGFVNGISGVDAVIAGHEHVEKNTTYTDADGKEIPLVEAGYYFYEIGVLELTWDPDAQEITDATETFYTAQEMTDLTPDADVLEMIAEIEEREQSILSETVGSSPAEYPYSWEEVRVSEQAIGRIVTAAYLNETGADVAFENAGGIRAGLPEGDVTYGDLISISPYGNVLVTKEITGQEILDIVETSLEIGISCSEVYEIQKQALEDGEDPYQYEWPDNSGSYLQMGGLTAEYDPQAEEGSRVISIRIGGEELDPEKTYTVAVNNYTAENEVYPALAEAELVTEFGTCENALREYIEEGGFEEAAETPALTAIQTEEETEAQTEADTEESAGEETKMRSTEELLPGAGYPRWIWQMAA